MACGCNWTSYFRSDDAKVPAVEKYRQDTATPSLSSRSKRDLSPPTTRIHYPETLEELQAFGETLETGDCLLMHCTHSFGKLAQLGTFSPWDHVAMIVKCKTPDDIEARNQLIAKKPQPPSSTMAWPPPGQEPTEVFEAMGGGVFSYPFTAHAICRGRFCKYVAVRRLRHSETKQPLSEEQQQKIEEFVREFWGRPYEEGTMGLIEIARPVLRMGRNPDVHTKRDKSLEALDNLFCSELITEAYQAAGILPEETLNSNEILPSMFAPNKAVDKYLDVQDHPYRLGPVEVFKAPHTPLTTAILDKRKQLKEQKQQQQQQVDPNNTPFLTSNAEIEALKPMPKPTPPSLPTIPTSPTCCLTTE